MKLFEWSGWPCWKLHRLNNPMNNSFSLHLLDCSDKSWAGWQILLWFREILLRAFQCPSGCCFCGTNLHFMKQRTTGTNRHTVKEVGAWITRRPNYNSICHSRHPILLGRGRGPIGIVCCYCPYCVSSWGDFLFPDLPVLQFVTIVGRFNFHINLVGGHGGGDLRKALVDIKIQQARPKSSSQKQSWQLQFQEFSIFQARRNVKYIGKSVTFSAFIFNLPMWKLW